MAVIKEVWGKLVSVDTDRKQISFAVQANPPEPQTYEEIYQYQLDEWTDEMFMDAVGFPIRAVVKDDSVTTLKLV